MPRMRWRGNRRKLCASLAHELSKPPSVCYPGVCQICVGNKTHSNLGISNVEQQQEYNSCCRTDRTLLETFYHSSRV